jgi:hypothetical protein
MVLCKVHNIPGCALKVINKYLNGPIKASEHLLLIELIGVECQVSVHFRI